MGAVNYDGVGQGAVEMGAVTSDAGAGATGAEDLTGAATADPVQADSAAQPDATDASATADTWDGSAWTLKYRDKPVVPQSRDELIKWAQLGYNNDQRMKTLDSRESKITDMERQLAQIKQISEAFEQRPDFKQAVFEIYQKLASGQQVAAEQQADQLPDGVQQAIAPYVNEIRALKEELGSIKGRFQEIDTKEADADVAKEVETLRGTYGGEEWDIPDSTTGKTLIQEVLEHAAANDFKSLAAAYKDLRWDAAIANAKAEALKQGEAAKINEQRAGIVGKGGQGVMPSAPKQVNVANLNYAQLAEMAKREMANS
jgi:hypothetical protein